MRKNYDYQAINEWGYYARICVYINGHQERRAEEELRRAHIGNMNMVNRIMLNVSYILCQPMSIYVWYINHAIKNKLMWIANYLMVNWKIIVFNWSEVDKQILVSGVLIAFVKRMLWFEATILLLLCSDKCI